MHDSERHALSRAALLLLAVSLLRWAATGRSADVSGPIGGADVLSEHVAATTTAAAEGERRGRPLDSGERIDPNSASEIELDRLPGIGPATASAVVQARDTGVVFGRPDDLLIVRGIGPALLARIRPSLELNPRLARRGAPLVARPPGGVTGSTTGRPESPSSDRRVDVNRADAAELQRLPGIGPALAERIVDERRVRPFHSVGDLVRVRGIGSATVARLEDFATAGPTR